jgi:hypothetical protein
MDNSSKQTNEENDARDARDLLAAANHVRAVAIRRDSEAVHYLASRLLELAAVFAGAPFKVEGGR